MSFQVLRRLSLDLLPRKKPWYLVLRLRQMPGS